MQPHTAYNFCTVPYSFHKWDVIRVEAITLSCKIPQQTGHACIVKENLNVLSMLMNYKHLHLTYFMQKVITSVHSVNKQYTTIWGYFSKVKACQRLWSTLKFYSSIVIQADCKIKTVLYIMWLGGGPWTHQETKLSQLKFFPFLLPYIFSQLHRFNCDPKSFK